MLGWCRATASSPHGSELSRSRNAVSPANLGSSLTSRKVQTLGGFFMFKIRDPNPTLVQDRFSYCPETGVLYWRRSDALPPQWNGKWAGKPAGTPVKALGGQRVYLAVRISKVAYMAHRLIWILMTGRPPLNVIDHVDGDGLNNRWENLRDVSLEENPRNCAISSANTSGATGVYWHAQASKWSVQARYRGISRFGGLFVDKADAIKKAQALRRELGFHENHGKSREDRAASGKTNKSPLSGA